MEYEHPELESFRQDRIDELRRSHYIQHRDVSVASSSTMLPINSIDNEHTQRDTTEDSWPQDYFDNYLPESERMDIEPPVGNSPATIDSNKIEFVIATDFGTTFSSVAFTRRFQGTWETPQSVSRYPYDPFVLNGKESFEVPTQSCYPDIAMIRDHVDEGISGPELTEEIKDIFEDEDEIEEPFPRMFHQENDDDREGSLADEDDDMFIDEPDHALDEQDGLPFYHWGYQIQDLMHSDTLNLSQFQYLERFKLMLDGSKDTLHIRNELQPILARLKRWRMIREDHDVIADYLTKLFLHTKDQIKTSDSEFNDTCSIEHVLCVPNAWSSKACRTMQKAMESAIRRSGLGTLDNLFIITEPEAAATYVLHENNRINVHVGDTFIILDAGGGTVDITTYTVIQNDPLRLKEALDPKGALCGSSYLNQNFRAHLLERLELETYLERNGITIEGVVDEAMIEFENKWKRTVDFGDRRNPKHQVPGWSVKIPGLREDSKKRFIENNLLVEHNDLHGIFRPLLRAIGDLVEDQMNVARGKNLFVEKVILVGGFAGSPSLRGYLKRKLNIISAHFDYVTELMTPQFSYDTAVSLGAVRRALQKEDGPLRRTKSSFGFVQTDLYDKENIPAHKGIRPRTDPLDGRKYVLNTIYWLVQQGDTLPPRHEYSLEVEHTFALNRKKLLCEEILYVKDEKGQSHYQIKHEKNQGAEEAGRIVADMTFLLTNKLIEPSEPEEGFKGKRHYKVRFELVMIVEGRNLRFEARYPVGGEVIQGKRVCIAAAFDPGTK